MSEHATPDIVTIVSPDGSITLPAEAVRSTGMPPGARVVVRITEQTLSNALRANGVTEDEVDAISAAQLEPRENVLHFLSTEGALRGEIGQRLLEAVRSSA